MIKKLMLAASLLSMGAVASAANAADVSAPVMNWTGFHVGIGGGGSAVLGDASSQYWLYDQGTDWLTGADGNLGALRGFATGEIGFDYQMGSSFVVGALASYDFAGKGKAHAEGGACAGDWWNGCTGTWGFDNGGTTVSSSLKNSWFAGVRMGLLANESTLIYGLAGYSQGDATISTEMELDGQTGDYWYDNYSKSKWLGGMTLGAGVETLFTNNLSAKLEYRYTDYGTLKANCYDCDFIDGIGDVETKSSFQDHSIRAVLSYRFNMGM